MIISVHPQTTDNEALYTYGWITHTCQTLDVITKKTWSHIIWVPGNRKAENFRAAYLLALDIDQGMTIEEAKQQLKDFWHVIAPTKRHTEENQRFRVILKPYEPIFCPDVYQATIKQIGVALGADAQGFDLSRKWRPSKFIHSINQGQSVSLTMPEKPKSTRKRKKKDPFLFWYVEEVLQGNVAEGQRNQMLFKTACNLLEVYQDADKVRQLIETIPWFEEVGGKTTFESACKHTQTF
jgi:hypothetical protein